MFPAARQLFGIGKRHVGESFQCLLLGFRNRPEKLQVVAERMSPRQLPEALGPLRKDVARRKPEERDLPRIFNLT